MSVGLIKRGNLVIGMIKRDVKTHREEPRRSAWNMFCLYNFQKEPIPLTS
jgi:hypothetical protein